MRQGPHLLTSPIPRRGTPPTPRLLGPSQVDMRKLRNDPRWLKAKKSETDANGQAPSPPTPDATRNSAASEEGGDVCGAAPLEELLRCLDDWATRSACLTALREADERCDERVPTLLRSRILGGHSQWGGYS